MKLDLIRTIDTFLGIKLIKFLSICKFHKKKKQNIKKILCIKFFGIGNLILIIPSLAKLKEKYPDAKIDFYTLKQNKGILENCSFVDNVYYLNFKNIIFLSFNTFIMIHILRKNKYDLIYDFEQFARYSAIVSFFLNSRYLIGFRTKGQNRDHLYDLVISYKNNIHAVNNFYSLVDKDYNNVNLKLIQFMKNIEEEKRISNYLKKYNLSNNIIGIHVSVGINASVKMWPSSYYSQLINQFLNNHSDYEIVLTGDPSVRYEIEQVLKRVNHNYLKRIFFTYELKLKSLPYLISKFKVFISSDTGPMHMAVAQNIFVIALYGPANPKEYGPYSKNSFVFYKNLKCSPCITNFNNKETHCKNNICMKKITVDEVYNKLKEVIDKNSK